MHRSIKYNIWCSTEHGNRRLDTAYFRGGDAHVPVYLFFSVNGSGHFCGMAAMRSRVDHNTRSDVWSQDKWRGCFRVEWVYVKDVPNALLRNIRLENNDNKPVTNSRDTQEIPFEKGKQVLRVFHTFAHSSSILDDFEHYERKQVRDQVHDEDAGKAHAVGTKLADAAVSSGDVFSTSTGQYRAFVPAAKRHVVERAKETDAPAANESTGGEVHPTPSAQSASDDAATTDSVNALPEEKEEGKQEQTQVANTTSQQQHLVATSS